MRLSDPAAIGACLRRDTPLHLYELGDLDPFFWPRTRWWGLEASGELDVLAMIYDHPAMPTLLALCREPDAERMNALLRSVEPELPDVIYAHLGPGVRLAGWTYEDHGLYDKMLLTSYEVTRSEPAEGVVPLGPAQCEEVEAFYERCYPGNWFDARMLETGAYVGVRRAGILMSVAGVHVLSPEQRVAALGNIATDASLRRRGLGRRVTAAVCRRLAPDVDAIGLNVAADNEAAIRCYRRLGFERVGSYREAVLRRR